MTPEQEQQIIRLRTAYESGALDKGTYEAAATALLGATFEAEVESGAAAQGQGATAVGARGVKARNVTGGIIIGNNNSVTYIRHIYQQAPGQPALDDDAFTAALSRYLVWVERRYGRLDLRGVEKREQQVLSLTLDEVYVSLAAAMTPERKHPAHRQPEQAAADKLEPVDMNRLLPLSPRLVIIGGPGSGKTTYLHLIAATAARALHRNQPELAQRQLGLIEPLPLPVVVSLSEYNRYRRRHSQADDPRQGTLLAFISHSLIRQQAAIGLPRDFFERLLIQGQSCLLLLDGLDEVANERERILVRRAVEELAYNDGLRQIVVTSRTRAYQGEAALPEEFRVAAVQPMTPEQVETLAARWCAAVYEEPTEVQQETGRLQAAIANLERHRRARQEFRLADTPLLVTIIAIVHYNQRRLPEQRVELYDKCVEVLLAEGHHTASDATYELADWGGSLAEKRGLLANLAYEMMSVGEAAGRSVSERQLKRWLQAQLAHHHEEAEAKAQLTRFIQAMRERGSLLDERGGVYQFTHLTFQEFLCAYYLAETVRDPAKMVAFLAEKERLAEAWWRETALLTAGYLGLKSKEAALTFIEQLTSLSPPNGLALAATELAGTALLELEGRHETTRTALADQLVTLLQDKAIAAAPALRALAGDALSRLGDPRPGVCTLEPEMIAIPAGKFLMGKDKLHEVEITEAYKIARYPVTNAQYQMFVEDGGYTERWRRCWTEAGWQWREDGDRTAPYDYDNFTQPNQPRVGATWYEAVAYARWLAAKTGKAYRLPTEAEWERTARHVDGRTYPWGEDWREGMTNSEEAGLGRTTAVGIFPQDTAVCGAQDMSGNVNEWQQTRWRDEKGRDYSPQPYRADDGREDLSGGDDVWRVWRGGAFDDDHTSFLRCGARGRFNPYRGVGWDGGFRLALSPFFDSER